MRLIDGDALMDALGITVECKNCSRKGTFGCKEGSAFVYACEAVTDAPAIDAVEVVRCKDCRYWYTGKRLAGEHGYCKHNDLYSPGMWFCADGKKKRGEKMSLYQELFWNHCNNCVFYHPVIDKAGYCGFKNSWMPVTGCCRADDFRKEKNKDASTVQVER